MPTPHLVTDTPALSPEEQATHDHLVALRKANRAEWYAKPRTTPAEILEFYQNSAGYVDELAAWHDTEARASWTAAIVEMATQTGRRQILDVGAGDGTDLRKYREAVPDVVVFGVEPNRHGRARMEAIGIPTAASMAEVATDAQFDLVTCMDVLEHVPDPVGLLDEIMAHIPAGGWLVESTATHDCIDPLHLSQLRGWGPGAQLRSNGFHHHVTGTDRVRFWRRAFVGQVVKQSVILCVYRHVEAMTAVKLWDLAGKGWGVVPMFNDALITRARNQGVSNWWREMPDDCFLMIDQDIVFDPADAEKIVQRCRDGYKVISAAYPVRDGSHLASRLKPGETVRFAPDSEPVEIDYAATGFLCVHRDVIDALAKRLPLCHPDQPWSFWSFFDTSLKENELSGALEYLSEDWDFCQKVRDAGFKVYLDPSIRLKHLGLYEWTMGDIGREPKVDNRIINIREVHGLHATSTDAVMTA